LLDELRVVTQKSTGRKLSEEELSVKIQEALEDFIRAFPVGPATGRKIFQLSDGTTVIVDPMHEDGGTAFVPYPKSPIQYFKDFVEDY